MWADGPGRTWTSLTWLKTQGRRVTPPGLASSAAGVGQRLKRRAAWIARPSGTARPVVAVSPHRWRPACAGPRRPGTRTLVCGRRGCNAASGISTAFSSESYCTVAMPGRSLPAWVRYEDSHLGHGPPDNKGHERSLPDTHVPLFIWRNVRCQPLPLDWFFPRTEAVAWSFSPRWVRSERSRTVSPITNGGQRFR
jgi:hypothetical protein